jgi:hypothetical protein
MALRGLKQAQQKTKAIIDDIKTKKAVRAMHRVLNIGSLQAAQYTPIDTSTLINSQFKMIKTSNVKITGRVGYTANYAVYVHDPAIAQNFRRAGAKKEFLTKGFEDSIAEINAAVLDEMKI